MSDGDRAPLKPERGLFLRWVKAPYWTPEEGIVLALGLEPKQVIKGRFYDNPRVTAPEPASHFVEMARRAVETGALPQRVEPRRFLEWAEDVGLSFHSVWKDALYEKAKRETQNSSGLSVRDKRLELIHNWVTTPTWTLEEGAALSLDVSPKLVRDGKIPRPHDASDEFARRLEFAVRASAQRQIAYRPAPRDFVEWAEGVGIRFHPDWHRAVPPAVGEGTKAVKAVAGAEALGTRERETLLKLVIGLAVGGYSYDPRALRSSVIPEIVSDLDRFGISLSDDTVRKWFREAANLLPQDFQDQ